MILENKSKWSGMYVKTCMFFLIINNFFMNTKKNLFFKVVSLLVMIAGCNNDKFETTKADKGMSTKTANEQISNLTWDYPVKPGSDEWRETSYDYKVEKSQPPKELLKRLDTKTLFSYCVDYPFNKVTLLFNNPNDGFKRAFEQSTVWKEFIQRSDAFEVFEKYFNERTYKQLFEMNNIEKRIDELFMLFFLEKIVSETDFVLNLDATNRIKLANTVLQSHLNKKEFPEEFIGFHYNSSLSALIKILEVEQVVFPADEISLHNFRIETNDEYYINDGMDAVIISKTINYLNQLK